mgnify:CR=1 FL=1
MRKNAGDMNDLGVDKSASDQEIKKAFRRVAMKHHPDRNPDNKKSDEKFKEAQEAYEILGDGDKKAAYDRFGHAAGDDLIRQVAAALRNSFRAGDVIARIGGDEFAIILVQICAEFYPCAIN